MNNLKDIETLEELSPDEMAQVVGAVTNEDGEILGVATLYGPVVADDGTLLLPGGLFVASNLSDLIG